MDKKWVALFSQSGLEVKRIAAILKNPDIIINNSGKFNEYGFNTHQFNKQECFDYIRSLDPEETMITLHGFLHIIPADICEKYEIYNGHPALIQFYPELKGKDPQERSVDYDWIGSVVHAVTPEVDGGEIYTTHLEKNEDKTLEGVYNTLRNTSLTAWIKFLYNKGIIE